MAAYCPSRRPATSESNLPTCSRPSRSSTCFADQLLGGAGAVHLRGVDMIHAEINASSQAGDCGGGVAFLDVPSSLADDADLTLKGTEPPLFDACPCTAPGTMQHDVARVRC
ncbi:MAG: hypothetical protein JWR80_6603 [Bradyrhizobium sp.]|nr:hypothetical protein [Bradyrhizobium sp.]